MTLVPFRCAISGQAFEPAEGGQCAICRRLVLATYLRLALFPAQKAPVCVECLASIRAVPKIGGVAGE